MIDDRLPVTKIGQHMPITKLGKLILSYHDHRLLEENDNWLFRDSVHELSQTAIKDPELAQTSIKKDLSHSLTSIKGKILQYFQQGSYFIFLICDNASLI
jgi:hypothetical protein